MFLPCDVLILGEYLSKSLDEGPLVNNKLCHLLFNLLILQFYCLYDSLFVSKLAAYMFILRLQFTVYLFYVLLELLETLVLSFKVALQLT